MKLFRSYGKFSYVDLEVQHMIQVDIWKEHLPLDNGHDKQGTLLFFILILLIYKFKKDLLLVQLLISRIIVLKVWVKGY